MTTGLRILVVDDDADNAASLGELFEMEGHNVSVVHSGEAAIRAYVSHDFDLAFMDVIMPGKNGVESFIEIRRMRPSAKVYMMTGYSVEELLKQAISNGALGVLEKPLDEQEVLRLSQSVGSGIVIANPPLPMHQVGETIHSTLMRNGVRSRLIRDLSAVPREAAEDEVLVIDSPAPVIDGVSVYCQVAQMGHRAPTFIVPATERAPKGSEPTLRDVAITGVLNKPFDPMNLLARLSTLTK